MNISIPFKSKALLKVKKTSLMGILLWLYYAKYSLARLFILVNSVNIKCRPSKPIFSPSETQ